MQQTKYMRIVAAGLLMTLFAACAKDDTIVPYDTTEGIPCTVTLNVGAAPAPEITVTRADNSLSTLSSLKIFVYDKDGQVCQNVATLSSTDITENDTYRNGNGETLYKVSIETTSGKKQLFAIANYRSGYWDQSGIDSLCNQAEKGALTLAQLRDGVISLAHNNFNINTDGNLNLPSITASNQMLISGWNTGVVFAANGSAGTVTYYGDRGDPNGSVAIKMQRSMARITFNIAAEVDGANGIFHPSTFRVYNIPRSTWLAANFDNNVKRDSDNNVKRDSDNIQTTYLTSALTNVGSLDENKYSFTFYMPENIQESKEGLTNYNQRDMWRNGSSGSATLPQNKKWTNAPEKSTFVVINGTYASNDGKYSGTVNYTVHLGDFGKKGGSMGNFSIERNYAYTYNMKVLDVGNIIVEAQKVDTIEYQHGAEGDIYDAKKCIYNYNLDAHYEQVYLEYDISAIAESVGEVGEYNTEKELDDAIANKLVLVIQSEAMDHNANGVVNKRGSVKPYQIYADSVRGDTDDGKQAVMEGAGSSGKPTKGFDYKWIEFYPQSSTEISPYPGVPSWNVDHDLKPDPFNGYDPDPVSDAETLMDAYDVCVALGKAVKELKTNQNQTISTGRNDDGIIITNDGGKYVARFTAFVNEYYYYRHPLTHEKLTTWSVLTNKIPREMIIAMSTDVSADGNSSYSQIYSYISQLSMQTFYNSRSMAINAFGIETYNETPIIPFGSPPVNGTLDDSDGRNNQIRLLNEYPDDGNQYGDWNNYIDASQNGWYSTTSTDRTKHKLKESAYKGADQKRVANAYYACLSRNRDLNGNGKIDDNEVRWYLASLNEYIRMGIGAGAISNAAQLYMGDKSTMVKGSYPSEYINLGSLYYTSSSADKRVYWAVEKGSYGAVGSSYNGANLPIRCIRILPAIKTDQDASAVYGIVATPTVVQEEKNGMIVLNFKSRLVDDLYRGYVEGSLGPHDEDDDENSFYEGVFVAEDYLKDKDGKILTYRLQNVIGAGVSMVNPCAGYSEGGYGNWRVPNLVELSAMNALGLLNECKNNGNTNDQAISCTQFSNLAVRYGFARSTLLFCPGGNGDELDMEYRIRCVRDVPPGSTLLE